MTTMNDDKFAMGKAGSDNADDLSITHLIVSITHLILSITNLIRLMIDYYDEYVRAAHHLTGICC